MAVKRRIVWFSDVEWEQLGRLAKTAGVSVSGYLRSFGWLKAVGEKGHAVQRPAEEDLKPANHMTQGERDAILRRINKGG